MVESGCARLFSHVFSYLGAGHVHMRGKVVIYLGYAKEREGE